MKQCPDTGRILPTHGKHGHRLYTVWQGMKARCNRKSCNGYERYGGAGIRVCPSWNSFEGFLADMEDSYKEGLQLDRIDGEGDYTPENCRWVTTSQQCRNKSDNVRVEIDGLSLVLQDWKFFFNLTNSMVYKRHERGELGYHLIRPSRAKVVEGSDYGLSEELQKLKLYLKEESL